MANKPPSADVHGGPGFRVKEVVERTGPDVIDGFRAFENAMVSDLMNRLYTMQRQIRPQVPFDGPVVGSACTVRVFPGDNLMVHMALDLAKPGDIIVIDASGSDMNAAIGDMIATKAQHRGIAGFVLDGLVRDVAGIEATGMPVFARGVTPIGPLHRGPGEVNFPIQCGGVVVSPGDVIVADRDGVVVIPREYAPELLERCRAKHRAEADYVAAVRRGQFDNSWAQEEARAGGCLFET
jgi:RraA family protein